MAGLGVPELLIILVILLVVFGPKRLPGLGRQLGGGMREFKDSITGRADHDDEQEEPARAALAPPAAPVEPGPPAPPAESAVPAQPTPEQGGAPPPPRA